MSDKVNATIVGHSYISRLHQGFQEGRFIPRGPQGLRYNFIGIGGARVYPPGGYKSIFRQIDEIQSRNPDIVFLHIGENDIGAHGVEIHQIEEHLIRLIETIVRRCRPKVMIVGQLTQFPAHWRHGTAAKVITRRIQQYVADRNHHLGNTKLKVWEHQIKINGVNGGRFFDRDDVHLNTEGMERYYHSVTAAVGRYARVVIEERKFD